MFEWFFHFKSGEMSIDDLSYFGRLSMAQTNQDMAKIREIVLEEICGGTGLICGNRELVFPP